MFYILLYLFLEPKWPLFLKVNPPKQGLFQPKQGSFRFQVNGRFIFGGQWLWGSQKMPHQIVKIYQRWLRSFPSPIIRFKISAPDVRRVFSTYVDGKPKRFTLIHEITHGRIISAVKNHPSVNWRYFGIVIFCGFRIELKLLEGQLLQKLYTLK